MGVAADELSTLLNRLCHMIVLTKEGKVEEAADHLLVNVLALDSDLSFNSAQAFIEAIDAYFNVALQESLVRDSLDRQVRAGTILWLEDRYALAPHAMAAASERVAAAVALEAQVQSEWFAQLDGSGRAFTADQKAELWRALRAVTANSFLRHGAQTAQMLSPDVRFEGQLGRSLRSYIDEAAHRHCPSVNRDAASEVLHGFFQTATPARSRYLAQLLDGTFTLFALSVDRATAKYLQEALHPLAIFLDTNFIFGILGMHDHPLMQVSKELVEVIKTNGFPFTLYYHEETLQEYKRTINAIGDYLRDRQWQQAISRAAISVGSVSGLERRFHQLNAQTPTDPNAFLARYQGAEELLDEFGAKRWPTEAESNDDMVARGAQVAEYLAYLQARQPPRKKPYEAMNHDITVWRLVQRLRKSGSSALAVGALFLTVDYTFYRYDWDHLRKRGEIGGAILPDQLLQLVRPFVPSTDDFDKRFVETFAVPEVRGLGVDYTITTSKILSYLNTFRDVKEGTAVRIIANQMLIEDLRGVDSRSREFAAAVDNALANDNAVLLEERNAALAAGETARTTAANLEEEISRVRSDSERHESEAERREGEALADLDRKDAEIAELGRTSATQALQIRALIAAAFCAVGLIAIAFLPTYFHWQWLADNPNRLGLYLGASAGWLGLCWGWADQKRRWVGAAGLVLVAVGALITIAGK